MLLIKKTNTDTKNMLLPHHDSKKRNKRFYKSLLSIIIYEKEITDSLWQWFSNIDDFHHKHVILPINKVAQIVFEEECHMY